MRLQDTRKRVGYTPRPDSHAGKQLVSFSEWLLFPWTGLPHVHKVLLKIIKIIKIIKVLSATTPHAGVCFDLEACLEPCIVELIALDLNSYV